MLNIIVITVIILLFFLAVVTAIYHTVKGNWSSLMKNYDTSQIPPEKQRLIFWRIHTIV